MTRQENSPSIFHNKWVVILQLPAENLDLRARFARYEYEWYALSMDPVNGLPSGAKGIGFLIQ